MYDCKHCYDRGIVERVVRKTINPMVEPDNDPTQPIYTTVKEFCHCVAGFRKASQMEQLVPAK